MSSYGYNPITSKLDRTGNGGGGGGNITITTDDGNSRANTTFDLLGQNAGTVPVVDTATTAGDTLIENRAWETQYVVDPTATVGLRGTFQTIQAALNQAVADGMTNTSPRKILLRARNFTENLTIPGGAILCGCTIPFPVNGFISPSAPNVTGNHTIANSSIVSINDLFFISTNPGVDLFNCANTGAFYAQNCTLFIASGAGFLVNIPAGNSNIICSNCTLTATVGQYGISTASSGSNISLRNCQFANSTQIRIAGGDLSLYNCINVGGCFSTAGGSVFATNTTFDSGGTLGSAIEGTFVDAVLSKCQFNGYANYCVGNGVGDIYFDNCTINQANGVTSPPRLAQAGANVHQTADNQGNTLLSIATATSYAVTKWDYYIAVTSTAAARTITLPLASDCIVDQVFIIKDESLGAATNNITVSGNGTNIDGAATYVINTNGGYVAVKYNGTAFFIISNVSAGGGGGGGDVVGPASSVDLNLAVFDGLTGKLIQDTGISSVTPVFAGTVTTGGNFVMPDTNGAGTEGVLINANGDRLAFAGPPATANFCFGNAGNFGLAGIANTLVGQAAGNGIVGGNQNTAMGNASLLTAANTTGNSAYGYGSMQNLTAGDLNTAVGYGAMFTVASASNCTGIGREALDAATVGQANVGVGTQAGNAVDGAENTLIGAYCGNANSPQTVGNRNTALGNSALQSGCGDRNLVLGFGAGSAWSSDTESSNILLNHEGVSGENNTMRLGQQGTSPGQIDRAFIAGISGVTVASAVPALIGPTGQMGTIVSSLRYKENVEDLQGSILDLRPVSFNYKSTPHERVAGLIAEEVEQVIPQLVIKDALGLAQTVKYHELCNYLLLEVQRLVKRVEQLEYK